MRRADRKEKRRDQARACVWLWIAALWALGGTSSPGADCPGWWVSRGVVTNTATTNDYAAANQGQLKWIASNACAELELRLPGGAGSAVTGMVGSFSTQDNYVAVNLGQLKNTAKPFCDRLIATGHTNGYPWGASAITNDYALANIGQVKFAFSFDIAPDTDEDGLPDTWEYNYFGALTNQNASGDADGDGLINSNEYTLSAIPTDTDTDDDRLQDGEEVETYSTSPTDSDSDNDNMGDGTEVDNGMSPSSSNAYYSLPFVEGFETNSVQAGSISNQNGWIAWPTNEAVVVTDNVHSGQQALALQESSDVVAAYHLIGTHGQTSIWVDSWAKFNTTNTVRSRTQPDVVNCPAWLSSIFTMNDDAHLVAYDGPGTNGTWWVVTNITVEANTYHRYTVNQDHIGKTWTLYFDGTNVLSGLGFRDAGIKEFSRFWFVSKWNSATYLDDVSVGTNRPAGLMD